MEATLVLKQRGDVAIVDVLGRITLAGGSSILRDEIRNLVDNGQKKLLLNMSCVKYIDTSDIGESVSALTYTCNHGGQLKLLNLTKRTKDLLQITHHYTDFEVFDDEAIALRSFH